MEFLYTTTEDNSISPGPNRSGIITALEWFYSGGPKLKIISIPKSTVVPQSFHSLRTSSSAVKLSDMRNSLQADMNPMIQENKWRFLYMVCPSPLVGSNSSIMFFSIHFPSVFICVQAVWNSCVQIPYLTWWVEKNDKIKRISGKEFFVYPSCVDLNSKFQPQSLTMVYVFSVFFL